MLQILNKFCNGIKQKISKIFGKIRNSKESDNTPVIIGIQGGIGSFNELACHKFVKLQNIKSFKTKYLYTTENVLKALEQGEIHIGIFAVHNAVGGVVWETARALAKYRAKIIKEFYIPIKHHLMILPQVELDQITQIMAHPQVLKQCKNTLVKKYPNIRQVSGQGNLIDTAKAAQELAKGNLPRTTAILGPISLSKLYGLKIVDKNLQDLKDNKTYFFAVRRYD